MYVGSWGRLLRWFLFAFAMRTLQKFLPFLFIFGLEVFYLSLDRDNSENTLCNLLVEWLLVYLSLIFFFAYNLQALQVYLLQQYSL